MGKEVEVAPVPAPGQRSPVIKRQEKDDEKVGSTISVHWCPTCRHGKKLVICAFPKDFDRIRCLGCGRVMVESL